MPKPPTSIGPGGIAEKQVREGKPVLVVDGLTVRLPPGGDRSYAIEDVSFQVQPREILCVVGESGSGKSVTAHTIMGLLPRRLTPVAGKVWLLGEELLDLPPHRLRALRGSRMAMIFQEPMTALNPVLPLGFQIEEVMLTHTDMSPQARKKRVLELMQSVRLPDPEHLYRAYPHQISGGQRQRVMIAMALALEPALLVADEPTTALDVTTQARILALMRQIQAEHNIAILFITHDFGVVAEIAHRVVVMREGQIVEQGPRDRVLRRPQHPYTQMLIAAVPSLSPKLRAARASREVVLATRGLSKTYGSKGLFGRGREVHAANDVTLELRRGETLGIVGESGSGKSTVARCVLRLVDPTAGGIELDGVDIARMRAGQLRKHRRQIQIVFQDPYRSLNPRRTVGASIIEGPMNFGIAREEARRRAGDLMELVGLEHAALSRFPHQFSGGQRQRICIARALAMEPSVLVADEPVSALDVSVQAQVLRLLDDVRRRFNLAMMFITHDLRVAAQVCDRIAVMHQGNVVEHGDVREVFTAPKHPYTRELLAGAPGKDFDFGRFDFETAEQAAARQSAGSHG